VSLFLWSSLITVTLAALSVGYALGGRWADRGPSYFRLSLVLAAAGVWLLLTPWLKAPLLGLLEPLGLRAAVLAAAAALFFVPLTLLGMVSPYAIRLRASSLDEVGRTAGNIYAVSTLASVVAALLTGFVLIPSLGVSRLLLLVGVLLLVGAGMALRAARRGGPALVVNVLLVAGGAILAGMAPGEHARPEAGLLDVRQSAYAELRVADWEGDRILFLDGGSHTVTMPEVWQPLLQYAVVLDVIKHLYDEPGTLCLVGLGGASVAKSFDQTGWQVDAVEIDSEVVSLARTYFGLEDEDARVFVEDGRRYFKNVDRKYDLVVLDAFGSGSIPFHLVTREAFALMRSRMTPGGILALNIESEGWYHILVRSLAATLRTSFAHVIALPIAEPENAFGNLILLASDRPLEFNEAVLGNPYDYLNDAYWHWVVVERNHAWANRFEPELRGAPVLTDDRNPVDLWSEGVNHKSRELFHQEPGWAGLAY
jgi:spermidine synthase